MCWSFNFGLPGHKKQKLSSSAEKKRRDRPADETLRGHGKHIVADVSEKRASRESTHKRRSTEDASTRSPRRARDDVRSSSQQQHHYHHHHHEDPLQQQQQHHRRPALNLQVPEVHRRSVAPVDSNSSQEALLNPRPHRSPHTRQRHSRRTSQTTLRGRGAKRDPPRHSKSKKGFRAESSRAWSFFAPTPPKTPKRDHRTYQALDSPPPPRSHRSPRQHRSPQTTLTPEPRASQVRRHRSRQRDPSAPISRPARSSTPNTTARRVPDRRFAVLAATNQALETVRREAFAQPSPPPRRERLRRYEGVTIPTSTIPFNWDCVSSSQASAGQAVGAAGPSTSSRQRRSRRS